MPRPKAVDVDRLTDAEFRDRCSNSLGSNGYLWKCAKCGARYYIVKGSSLDTPKRDWHRCRTDKQTKAVELPQ